MASDQLNVWKDFRHILNTGRIVTLSGYSLPFPFALSVLCLEVNRYVL